MITNSIGPSRGGKCGLWDCPPCDFLVRPKNIGTHAARLPDHIGAGRPHGWCHNLAGASPLLFLIPAGARGRLRSAGGNTCPTFPPPSSCGPLINQLGQQPHKELVAAQRHCTIGHRAHQARRDALQ